MNIIFKDKSKPTLFNINQVIILNKRTLIAKSSKAIYEINISEIELISPNIE